MIANMVELDHQPWALDPRHFLQRMIAAARRAGPRLRRRLRERVLPRVSDGRRLSSRSIAACASARSAWSRPSRSSRTSSPRSPTRASPSSCRTRSSGWGQQELSIRHAPALQAADNQITYRQTVRGVAAQHGMVASLAPKPWADQAGQRRPPPLEHLGRRPRDERARRSAGVGRPERRSARHAIGGVLQHLPGPPRPHDAEHQLVPAAPAALLELGLHGLGDREPRGRGPRPEPLLGRRGRAPRTSSSRRATTAPTRTSRSAASSRPRSTASSAASIRASRSTRIRATSTDDEREKRGIRRFPTTVEGGARRAGARRGPDGGARRPGSRRSTSRSGAPRPPRTPSRTRRSSSTTTSSSTDRAVPVALDLAAIPIVDNHCHSLLRRAAAGRRGVPDPPDRVVLPGDRPGPRPARRSSTAGRWSSSRRSSDCEPTPDAVHAARRERGVEWLTREIVERGELQDLADRHGLRRRHDVLARRAPGARARAGSRRSCGSSRSSSG